jgi:hypothetical protein
MNTETNKFLGWIQCTQCGWGTEVSRQEVEADDYHDGQACPSCDLGPCRIDWSYLDGPGWVASCTKRNR